MRAQNDRACAVEVGRIQDETRWTKALGDTATVAESSKEVLDATAKKWGAELFGTNGKK